MYKKNSRNVSKSNKSNKPATVNTHDVSSQKTVDNTPAAVVSSPETSTSVSQEGPTMTEQNQTTEQTSNAAPLTFKRNDKQRRSNMIVFDAPEGRRGSIRVSKTLFAKDAVPTSIDFGHPNLAQPKVPMSKLSAEERKALRASKPKLTPAEKLAKAEERVAKLRQKMTAPVAGTEQAEGSQVSM